MDALRNQEQDPPLGFPCGAVSIPRPLSREGVQSARGHLELAQSPPKRPNARLTRHPRPLLSLSLSNTRLSEKPMEVA